MSVRRGMLIKNVSEAPAEIRVEARTITMAAGDEVLVDAEEVRHHAIRTALQRRTIAIVRPWTDAEADAFPADAA